MDAEQFGNSINNLTTEDLRKKLDDLQNEINELRIYEDIYAIGLTILLAGAVAAGVKIDLEAVENVLWIFYFIFINYEMVW